MKKFGFIADLSDSDIFDADFIVEGFAVFSKDLTPKHIKFTHCRIITQENIQYTEAERIIIGPLNRHTFEEASWTTDWLYFLPNFSLKKWLSYAAMIGPGPVLSQAHQIDLNPKIVIPCLSENDFKQTEELSECIKAVYYDEGGRKIFSKAARRILSEEVHQSKVLNPYKV